MLNLSVINDDICEFFGGTNTVLEYISEEKLNYISLFKGYVISVNSWDLNIDLSVFNILKNSVISLIDNDNSFSYNRVCTDNVFGLDDLDKDLIFNTPHAGFVILTFKSIVKNIIIDSYLLIWVSHKLKDSDLAKLISYSLSNNVQIKIQDKNEIYLNTNYYLNDGAVYYKYLSGIIAVNQSYNQINELGEEFEYNQNDSVFYPYNGWYIFYQKVKGTTGLNIYPLNLYNLSGLGYRRLRFNKSGSVFINTSNSYLQSDNPSINNITSNEDSDLFVTDRFIKLEGYLVYKKASDCNNINVSFAHGTVNVFEFDPLTCGDILTTAIFGSDSLNKTDFLDTEIFIDEDSFLNECINSLLSYPTQSGYCNNNNKAIGGFNTRSEASSVTINNNNSSVNIKLIAYFVANTNNRNTAVLNTLLNIANTYNNNVASGLGQIGKLSSYGSISNINISIAISTIPFYSSNVNCINKNVSSSNFSYTKGLVATCINKQTVIGSIQRRVISQGISYNLNISSGDNFISVPSSNGNSAHLNVSTASGLYGQVLSGTSTHINISRITILTVSYQGAANCRNSNSARGISSAVYLAPIAITKNTNSFTIIV